MHSTAEADRSPHAEGRKSGPSPRNQRFFVGLARAFAGSLIFALPMLMTMEMWWIGFYIEPSKLILMLVIQVPLLIGLARFGGFQHTASLRDDVVDGFVAIAVALAMSASVLCLFGVITPAMPPSEIIGKVALQAFPGSFGAILARAQTGDKTVAEDESGTSYPGELLLMAAGALFLGLNVAPTEEMVLISYMIGPWREIALVLVSLLLMHAFVYSVDFPGERQPESWSEVASLFLRFTVTGYAIVLIICLYLLWTFGRTEGVGIEEVLSACIVLGFPCAIGAAAARIIL